MAMASKHGQRTPQATCWCGWDSGAKESWTEAGKAMDEHLAAEKRQLELREEARKAEQ